MSIAEKGRNRLNINSLGHYISTFAIDYDRELKSILLSCITT